MNESEPLNLAEWFLEKPGRALGRLFTCGRPGRGTYRTKRTSIPVDVIDRWVKGLPSGKPVHIVSLLGQKKDRYSEFEYYPFRSSREEGPKPTFQDWLDARFYNQFVVHEFPTTDRMGVPPETRSAVAQEILTLLASDCVVVVIDSAGSERTARVCEAAGYQKRRFPE